MRILVVEDDHLLNNTLCYNLVAAGYAVDAAMTKAAATQLSIKQDYDLIVLDVNLPDGNGFVFCEEIKERRPDTAVIFLTARDMERDQLRGYELGADDYVTKPFPMSVFQKKVAALLARISKKNGGDYFDDGNLLINFSEMAATLADHAITFTPMEYRLLKVLTKNPQMVLTRRILLEKLWDIDDNFVDEHALTSMISRVRNKIENKNFQYINKLFISTLSLSLGIILSLLSLTLVSSYNMEHYVSNHILWDYILTDRQITNFDLPMLNPVTDKDGVVLYYNKWQADGSAEKFSIEEAQKIMTVVTDTLLQDIADIPGVIQVDETYAASMQDSELSSDSTVFVQFISKEHDNAILALYPDSNLEMQKFHSGEGIILTKPFNCQEINYKQGDIVRLSASQKEYPVLAVLDHPGGILTTGRSGYQQGYNAYLSDAERSEFSQVKLMSVSVAVSNETSAEAALLELVADHNGWELRTRSGIQSEFLHMTGAVVAISLALSICLSLIGLLNYINTALTSALARKRELAMLESIGMTKKQGLLMLISESIMTGIPALALSLTVGIPFAYEYVGKSLFNPYIMIFHFPWGAVIGWLVSMIATAVTIGIVSYRSSSKQSVVERLRTSE